MKRKTLLISLVSVLIISIVALAGCSIITDTVNGATSAPANVIGRHEIDIENMESPSVGEVVANNCLHSVCMITAATREGFVSSASLGSGFFVNEQGYIITNEHVVANKDFFTVTVVERSVNGSTIEVDKTNVRLIHKDAKLDLAILKLETRNPVGYLTFAKENDVAYGQTVYTIGNPNGLFFSMISGMVANPAYSVNGKDSYQHIVLDANINHGNSGGALINAKSEVVGVIDARLEGSTPGKENDVYGLGLAIPNKVVKEYLTLNNVKYYVSK